jgi:hypothetical protein
MKAIAQEHGVSELPALILFQKHRPLVYKGVSFFPDAHKSVLMYWG